MNGEWSSRNRPIKRGSKSVTKNKNNLITGTIRNAFTFVSTRRDPKRSWRNERGRRAELSEGQRAWKTRSTHKLNFPSFSLKHQKQLLAIGWWCILWYWVIICHSNISDQSPLRSSCDLSRKPHCWPISNVGSHDETSYVINYAVNRLRFLPNFAYQKKTLANEKQIN